MRWVATVRYTILCGARLMRTGRRDVCFGLFLLRFDEGNKCQSHMGGLNMIYRRYGGWLSRARRCLLAGLHRIGAWTQSVPEMWPEGAGAPTRGCGAQVANRNRWLCRWWTGGTAHHVSSCGLSVGSSFPATGAIPSTPLASPTLTTLISTPSVLIFSLFVSSKFVSSKLS
jgi:hypothetical protein